MYTFYWLLFLWSYCYAKCLLGLNLNAHLLSGVGTFHRYLPHTNPFSTVPLESFIVLTIFTERGNHLNNFHKDSESSTRANLNFLTLSTRRKIALLRHFHKPPSFSILYARCEIPLQNPSPVGTALCSKWIANGLVGHLGNKNWRTELWQAFTLITRFI